MRNGYLGRSLGSVVFQSVVRAGLIAGSVASVTACSANSGAETGDDGGGGGDDGGGGGGGGGGSGTVDGWTAMPLLDDLSDPDLHVFHMSNDTVTGIYYESPSKGFIATKGEIATAQIGGAVFAATGSAVTSVAYRGITPTPRGPGAVNFVGLERTPTGYIALAHASDVILSQDGGATWKVETNGGPGEIVTGDALGYKVTSTGTTLVSIAGVIAVSSDAPGPDTNYKLVWAPQATPPFPDNITANECHDAPANANIPHTHDTVYISPDRQRIAYTAADADTQVPEICLSIDGGNSFFPNVLDVPNSALDFKPSGVLFLTATIGITWFAQPNAGSYIKRTTDAGSTWKAVALPPDVASKDLELPAGFFAPDGQHGWLAGFDHTSQRALVLATTDSGITWTVVPGVANAVEAFHGSRLYSGFALDATHVWLGGESGVLMHN